MTRRKPRHARTESWPNSEGSAPKPRHMAPQSLDDIREAEQEAEVRRQAESRARAEARRQEEALRQEEARRQAEARARSEAKRQAEALCREEAQRQGEARRQEEARLEGKREDRPIRLRPHPRKGDRFAELRYIVRSPMFAYASAAALLTIFLFALTVPIDTHDPALDAAGNEVSDVKPHPENDEYVEPCEVDHELEGTSAEAVKASNAYGKITQAIDEFEDNDQAISFAMRDLTTGNSLSYDADRIQYPASSIKAPYVCSVYEELIENGETSLEEVTPLATETIIESSDDAYSDLTDKYGSEPFRTWLESAGVEPLGYESYEDMLRWHYPHINTNQLLLMWLHMYDYLQAKTEPSNQLADLLERREVSAMRNELGTDIRTWSKMGWFDVVGDFESEPATVEGGVVFSKEGTYVVAVMTTAPADISSLQPVFNALARAHFDMI